MKSSLEIAQEAELRPIQEIAAAAGLEDAELELYGRYKAKVRLSVLDRLKDRPDGKFVCVTAITPTPPGEGKTTTSVSLAQGMGTSARRPVLCLREPRSGPVFGIKGGAAGGGYAQVVPMEDLNLHFTGDMHAISAAHNLLAGVPRHAHPARQRARHRPAHGLWRRCVDMNDRALRNIVIGLGGRDERLRRARRASTSPPPPRSWRSSPSRAISTTCASGSARSPSPSPATGEPVTAEQLGAAGAMAVLLKDAIMPNLVQTLEGQPAFVHCGPFANIAHGNNSLIADRIALKLADYVVTEAGFGADMGMEKFMDIVCRASGLARPRS